MFLIQSTYLKTDVTAIKVWNHVFAGVGGFLHIYNLYSSDLITKIEVFEGQKIHGLIFNSDKSKIIVYGGKHIAIISNQIEIEVSKRSIFFDWILDAKWIENDTKIVAAFMHNIITICTEDLIQESEVKCEEKCILYSAHISFENYKNLLILSGTVLSDVLLWKPFYLTKENVSPVLHRLRQHKGVIFSIDCHLELGLVCTTSDDRSAVLWKISKDHLQILKPDNSHPLKSSVCCQVYGHSSRVFCCCISDDSFITAGEDSLLIIWSFEGNLLRKIDSHQGGAVWSLDYNKNLDIVCSGGNDGGILIFKKNLCVLTKMISLPNEKVPKFLGVLRFGNLVCLSEEGVLYYYDVRKNWNEICLHSYLKSYAILQVSLCRRMVALAGFSGEIYIYKETHNTLENISNYTLKNKTRIFSFHWLNCKTFLVCQNQGKLHLCFLNNNVIHPVQTFILPSCKERWSTSASLFKGHLIVGDRKGNVHNYAIGISTPINSQRKAHNHLGVTNLLNKGENIISLGRDSVLKRYIISGEYVECVDSNKTKFSWLAGLENNYLLSFSGDNFVISDCKTQRVLFQICCGGGHRSWDYSNNTFVFIKQKVINIVGIRLECITPSDIILGNHVREINSLKLIKYSDNQIIISGGEDTTLRIGVLDKNNNFKSILQLKVHLSSIRTIEILKKSDKYLVFSAGGRAQIICWNFSAEFNNGEITATCVQKYNYYEPLCQKQSETRIMYLSAVQINHQSILFAGCSDGCIKVFSVTEEMGLRYHKTIFNRLNSITKILNIRMLDKTLLISMSMDGYIVFWNVSDILTTDRLKPVASFQTHQSGINSYSYKILDQNRVLFLTGGDDNAIVLTLFKLIRTNEVLAISKIGAFENKAIHCAQVTGALIYDRFLVTSSIDQRIAICKWTVFGENVEFEFVQKYVTTIADPQGLEYFVIDNVLSAYIYGNGFERVVMKKK